jgi:molybdopterin-guanine dinucleotide biosynthesis protein A
VGVSAIVLAGGRSSRFGRDKLVEPLGGGTVLTRTIAAVRAVASDVVVVASADASPDLPSGVRLARDPVADGGPLVGVVAGLDAAANEVVLVVGGDMPWLVPEVLAALVAALGSESEIAVLESSGRVQQLPVAVRRTKALAAARTLTDGGVRRLGALGEVLSVAVLPEPMWRVSDPDGATLRDIDEPGDLSPG